MPVEESHSRVVDNLGLDLNPYNIVQGKSFTRSVSISEPTSSGISTSPGSNTISHSAITGSCLPSVRSASGEGGSTSSVISYSPFSSAATAITPESPLPDPSCFQSNPLSSLLIINNLEEKEKETPAEAVTSIQESMSMSSTHNEGIPVHNDNTSIKPSECLTISHESIHDEYNDDSQSISVQQNFDHDTQNYAILLQNPYILRTVNFLSHLLDSRLSPDWRLPLEYWQRNCLRLNCYPSSISQPQHQSTTTTTTDVAQSNNDEIDVTDFTPLQHYTIAGMSSLQSPSDQEECSVKRFKPNNSQPLKKGEVQTKSDESSNILTFARTTTKTVATSSSGNHRSKSLSSKIPSTFITARLILCSRNLADHFESRYHDKLGNLLDDVARLNNTSNSTVNDDNDETGSYHEHGSTLSKDDIPSGSKRARCQFHSVLEELFAERINWGRIIAMLAFLRALCEVIEENRRVTSSLQLSKEDISKTTVSTSTASCERLSSHTPIDSSNCDIQALPSNPSPSCSYENPVTSSHESPKKELHLRPCAADYVLWTAEFIHGPRELWNWISSHGNWEGLIDFESQRNQCSQLSNNDDDDSGGSLIGLVTGFTDDETLRSLRSALTGVATIANPPCYDECQQAFYLVINVDQSGPQGLTAYPIEWFTNSCLHRHLIYCHQRATILSLILCNHVTQCQKTEERDTSKTCTLSS
ncbi:unnamed protein product [Heterobilharzia americana]|nr:unnamed protein product [Heterobilharzia americana]